MLSTQWRGTNGARPGGWMVMGIVALLMLGTSAATAQYQVYAWYNFDDGRLDAKAVPLGRNAAQRVAVMAYPQGLGAPTGLYDALTAREIGGAGLLLKTETDPNSPNHTVGLASNVILQRSRLGRTGRALFQADFFIPPQPQIAPSLAVLAMAPLEPGRSTPSTFYRFGIAANRDVYFSLIAQGGTAPLYMNDKTLFNKLPRGAWHRFAIVCEGEQTIRCYVDGREASFSPLQDNSLQNLQVGVMLADKSNVYSAWVDNLSIQWTHEDVPLPDSPWLWTWPGGPPRPALPGVVAMGSNGSDRVPATPHPGFAPPSGQVVWFDAADGWDQSQKQQKPMLVYFQAPHLPVTRQLEQLLQTDAAKAYLARHACVKVDVNQLHGGTYAERFKIFKVPTMIVFDMQGNETNRAVFNKNDTWPSFEAKLRGQ